MPPPPQSTADAYQFVQRLQVLTVAATRRAWARMLPDFDTSWAQVGPAVVAVTAAAQLAAATRATVYVPQVLEETGQPDEPGARVRPRAFAGRAADGRSLPGLLLSSVVRAKVSVGTGAAPEAALEAGGRWLDALVQTSVTDSFRLTTEAEIAVRPDLGFVRMVNPPCCGRCAILAGRWYRYDAGFNRHPRCFPAGVVVSGPAANAATRRWYEGELVVLRTASGQRLPVTGNHPILTDRGWVPANLIQEGDHVVRSTLTEGARALVVPDEDQVPSRIQDLWRPGGVMPLVRMPTAPEDFHGDGLDGHVDVVFADRLLRDGSLAAGGQPVEQAGFSRRIATASCLAGDGSAFEMLQGLPDSSDGVVGGGGLGEPLGGGHLLGAHLTCPGPVADRGAVRYQMAADHRSGDSQSVADAVLALSGAVSGGDGRAVHRRGALARWDAPPEQFSMESRVAYRATGEDLRDRLAGQVELDRVVETSRVQWSGHVFNLTSDEGWYSANGLIVSNCDCLSIPASENVAGSLVTDPKQLFDSGQVRGLTKRERDRLDAGDDPVKVVNESRDMWRARIVEQQRKDRDVAPVVRQERQRQGLEELFASTRDRIEANRAMQAQGFTE